MLTKIEANRILKLLKTEVVPAVGCTEPLTVALVSAKARQLLGCMPEHVVARLSAHIIKNAIGVGIPGADGLIGLPAAVALGAIAGRPELDHEVLSGINSDDVAAAKTFIAEQRVEIKQSRACFERVYVEIDATAADKRVKIVMAKSPLQTVYVKVGDEIRLDERYTLAQEPDRSHETTLSMPLIYEFALKTPLEDLQFIIDGARMNKKVAEMAFVGDYGLNLGRMLRGSFEERMVGQNAMPHIVCYTCAACDVRMSGAQVPVMTTGGSGNQGIAATMPVLVFAEETQCTESKLARALAMSQLTVIYIRQLLGHLSSHCRCSLAATGAACGLTYLLGGTYEQITYAVKNFIASQTGMVCDGVKPSCTLKLSSAASSAFQAAMMAIENIKVDSTDGIIDDDVDKSLDNLADIGRDALHQIDNIILQIMEGKKHDS